MAFVLSTDNAIAFAQVRLRGGWRNLLMTTVAYAVLIGATMYVTTTYSGGRRSAAYTGWATGLLGLQALMLLIFGATRVAGAVRTDITSGMIESHRLMPLPAGQAMVGYLFGATCQAIALGVVNLLIGAYAVQKAGLPIDRWLAANGVLAIFCVFVWASGGLLAFVARGAGLILFLPLTAIWISQGLLMAYIPALAVLMTPLAGNTVFSFSAGVVDPRYVYGVGATAQLFFAGVCFAACCRKYRRADAQGITAGLGLVLLGGWVIVSSFGIRQWDAFAPRILNGNPDTESQLIGSIIATMLLALLPISAAAQADTDWQRRRRASDPALSRRPVPPGIVVGLATLLTVALANVEWTTVGTASGRLDASLVAALAGPLVQTAAVVCLFLLSVGYLLRIVYHVGGKPIVIALFWLVLTWLIPIVAELIVLGIRGFTMDEAFPGTLAACSPPVSVTCIWRPDTAARDLGGAVTFALAVQGALTLLLAWLYYGRALRGRGRSKARGVDGAVP
jgi:hypothetical protein